MKMLIPIAEPVLGKEEEKLVLDGLRSGWISSTGKYINLFEQEYSKFCKVKYAIAVSNGTSALHLALVAAEIGLGDEVIVPTLTFVATANAVVYTGAKPIFADSEKDTWNIDPEQIKEKITPRTKAIIPVHLYGHPADMGIIQKIAKKYNLFVIEDAAEAHGALYKKKVTGSLGDMGCFSFYANKVITTGEGGMITTSNRSLAEKIRMLRDHGASKRRKYYHPKLGFNYRMTNLQAALGLAQLRKINSILDKKIIIANWYKKYLSDLEPNIILQPEAKWAKNIYWMYSILILKRGKVNRDFLISELKKKGIDSRPFFFPIHRHKRYQTSEAFPIANYLSYSGVNLPSSVNLEEEQIKFICDKITQIINKP